MVKLTELSPERFQAYRRHLVAHYAQDKADAGVWSREEAPRRAAKDIDALLPEGTGTAGHFLYAILDDASSEEVGTLWFAVAPSGGGRGTWIYDIEIFDGFRRRGLATEALQVVEQKARELGADKIELHVFGHNAARRLYERTGYAPTSIVMSKRLG